MCALLWSRVQKIIIVCCHNSKKFPNLNIPPNQKPPFSKNISYLYQSFRFAPLWWKKRGIWGNLAKISHHFLRMEPIGKFWTVRCEFPIFFWHSFETKESTVHLDYRICQKLEKKKIMPKCPGLWRVGEEVSQSKVRVRKKALCVIFTILVSFLSISS